MLCARLRAQPLEGGKAALPTGRDEGLSLAVGELNVVEKCITSWSGRPGARSSGSRLRWNPPPQDRTWRSVCPRVRAVVAYRHRPVEPDCEPA